MPRFDAFGRIIDVTRVGDRWRVSLPGSDGTSRDGRIEIPAALAESELADYLTDLYHESATPDAPEVTELGPGGRLLTDPT